MDVKMDNNWFCFRYGKPALKNLIKFKPLQKQIMKKVNLFFKIALNLSKKIKLNAES